MIDPLAPYNSLPPLPPAQDVETKAVLKAVAEARSALGELKGRTRTIPNPDILLNTLALQEARSSSEIENIFTTNDQLYRGLSMDEAGLSPEQKEVLHYKDALWRGAQTIRERPFLSTNLFIEIVQTIKGNSAGIRQIPRTQIKNAASGEIIYTPPEGEEIIRSLLGNLERFSNDADEAGRDLDPLVKMALIHYQFEAIHPFHDGNGRAGRLILILYLMLKQLLDQPVLFLSRYIIANKGGYYRNLREVTETGAWEPWVLYLVRAVEETARTTSRKIEAIELLLEDMTAEVRKKLPKIYSKELVTLLFKQPYCKIEFVVREDLAERKTAATYLRKLEEAGLLRSQKAGRELIFLNHRLMDLLSASDGDL